MGSPSRRASKASRRKLSACGCRAARVMEDEAIVQAMEVNAEQVQDTLKLMQL